MKINDGRTKRKAKVIQFVTALAPDRQANLENLISKAKLLKLEGFDSKKWADHSWIITKGRLATSEGRTPAPVEISFVYPPKLNGEVIPLPWSDCIKACFVLRFHSKNQSVTNQRNFIVAFGYLAYCANQLHLSLDRVTPQSLNIACHLLVKDYSESTAYNLHKAVAEIAAIFDGNGICRIVLDYKYYKMKRPDGTGGLKGIRLDDPVVVTTTGVKIIPAETYKILGELYQKVPKSHKYRFYVLVIILLACLGRRFSEIILMPLQKVEMDDEGRSYISVFGRKRSQGDSYTPLEKVFMPSDVIPIVSPIIEELSKACTEARKTAVEMYKRQGPDFSFLDKISSNDRLYKDDLIKLGISDTVLSVTGWIRINSYAFLDIEKTNALSGKRKSFYTTLEGIKAYCYKDFQKGLVKRIHIDGSGKKYYLGDLLLVRFQGFSSGGGFKRWIATQCTHSMFTTFLRYVDDLVNEFATSQLSESFTSHHFRHTLNTLLDEGGLSDLLQTEWFGRSNPRDTKAYQHTSREKRALEVRRDLAAGRAGGKVAEIVMNLPVTERDAFLKARINAVHDVGTGICIHNFVQVPCERHLQCTAKCDDYVWSKDDKGRLEEVKRQYSLTYKTRLLAEERSRVPNKKMNSDWLAHSDKKLKTLHQQLVDNGIHDFDPINYIKGKDDGVSQPPNH